MSGTHPVTLLVLASTLAACGDNDVPRPEARLQPLASCEAAKEYLREVALARMNRELDQQIAAYSRGEHCGGGRGGLEDDAGGSPTGGGDAPPAPDSGPAQGTGTNNQIAGVDEADFVKNDGQYIYLAQNGVFRIIDSWPASETHEVSATVIDGTPRKLFVAGDRALIYVAVGANASGGRDCTYGYDCNFTGDGTATTLLVFDLTDRAAPRLVREVGLSGSLIAGRRIGGTVHTVVTQAAKMFDVSARPEIDLCGYADLWSTKPTPLWLLKARIAYEELRAENTRLIEETDLDVKLPTVTDSAFAAAASEAQCTSLYASAIQDGLAFTSLVSLDLDDPGPVFASTIVSSSGAVHASSEALYLAVPHKWTDGDVSTIHKFRISESARDTHYLASGAVPGRALNQFAMDERDGFLRIATTDGRTPDPDAISHLSVLAEEGDDLVTVGSVGQIAPTEDIRSVRFDGDKVYIVTFKKTDPLFAFDLADPYAPAKLGELKIPGFSTYMHMLDDGHLLTIGYDADDHGSFAYFDGVMLQIFDVTDPANLALTHKHVIGTRGSSSEALTNHLAFTWYPEEALLAIPMTLCEGGDDGRYGSTMTFSGLMVFDASVALGFGEHGRVEHPVADGVTCGNWWTHGSSAVKRSLFLDEFVYSISDEHLKVRAIDALATELVTLPLGPPPMP